MPIPVIEAIPTREKAFAVCRWMRRSVSNVVFTVPFRFGNPMESALVSLPNELAKASTTLYSVFMYYTYNRLWM